MANIITELSKYILIVLMAFYALHAFIVFRYSNKEGGAFYVLQNIFMVFIHFLGYMVLFLQGADLKIMYLYIFEEAVLLATIITMRFLYPFSNRLIINNMCMLLSVSFIILCRINYDKCIKQFEIVTISLIIMFFVPKYTKLIKEIPYLEWICAGIGILMLGIVLILGSVTNGSKISFTLAGITFQPSEFVKILYVIFLSKCLSKSKELKNILMTSVIAAAFVLILVASKDLGGALIYFVVYIVTLYIATGGIGYLLAGLFGGAGFSVLGYKMFAHVRTRFLAWSDPFAHIDGQGYQITQSLFAIGTGSWLGMGLTHGSPEKIPVVDADFIFSAISEEFGGLFGICLILVCISTFVMFMMEGMKSHDTTFRIMGAGLGTLYGFQMFLTIGGVTKFIPLTGVTLPLVSYGGTSVLSTVLIFGLIQGIAITGRRVKREEE